MNTIQVVKRTIPKYVKIVNKSNIEITTMRMSHVVSLKWLLNYSMPRDSVGKMPLIQTDSPQVLSKAKRACKSLFVSSDCRCAPSFVPRWTMSQDMDGERESRRPDRMFTLSITLAQRVIVL